MNAASRLLVRLLVRIQKLHPPGLDTLILVNAALVQARWAGRRFTPPRLDFTTVIRGESYRLRPLGPDDLAALDSFLASVPEAERRFIPHGTGRPLLRRLLAHPALFCLGLHATGENRLLGYGLARPTASGRALIASFLAPEARGKGLGKLLIGATIDQARETGQSPYSTLYVTNAASLSCILAAGLTYERLDDEYYVCWDAAGAR